MLGKSYSDLSSSTPIITEIGLNAEEITLPSDKPPLAYADHMALLDDFVMDCNAELRKRGFHVCEASVAGDWMGQAVLNVTAAINVPPPAVKVLPIHCKLPLPWLLPEPMDLAMILSTALQSVEQAMIEMCSRDKVLRISFSAFAKKQSRTITIAPETNGKRLLVTTP